MLKKIMTGGALAMLLTLAACGSKEGDELLADMRASKDKICACKDMECVQKAQEEMMKAMMEKAEKYKDKTVSKGQQEEGEKLAKDIQTCVEKLTAAPAAGGEAPAAPAEGAPK